MRPYSFMPVGGVEFIFPIYERKIVAPIKYKSARMDLPHVAGTYDLDGNENVPTDKTVNLSFTVYDEVDLEATVDTICASFTKKGLLRVITLKGDFRTLWFKGDTDVDWSRQAFGVADVSIMGLGSPYWYSDSTYQQTLTGSGGTIVYNGKVPALDNLVITVQGHTSDALTSVQIHCGDISLQWSGSVAIGLKLIIDVGAFTILTDTGVDKYSGVVIPPTQMELFRLEPGANAIVIDAALPTNGQILFTWKDTWA